MTTADIPDVLPDSAYSGFLAPGPGTWLLDASHAPHPVARYIWDLFPEGFRQGFGSTFSRYGVLLGSFEARAVGGFLYNRLLALGAPPEAVGHPPKEVFDQILANDPGIQERCATAEQVWAERRWREDLLRWDTELKPAQIARRDALDSVDLGGLSDEQLLTHLAACADAYRHGWILHHTHNGAAILPVGDYLLATMGWTGLPPHAALAALSGTSPVSTGGGAELAALTTAIRGDLGAQDLLASGQSAADTIAALARRQGGVGETMRAYLAVARFLPVDGEDAIGVPTTIESPDLLIGRIRGLLDSSLGSDPRASADAAEAQLRAAVPAEHLAAFDELLGEARLVYRLRDERAVYGDRQVGTVLRRALLEAGERLAARGLLAAADHAVDLDAEECTSLLTSGSGPDAKEVAERVHWRLHADYRRMPPFFGSPPGPPLPGEWLPPAAARVHNGFGFAIFQVLGDVGPDATTSGPVVQGIPGASGSAEGRARLVLGVEDLDLIEDGDVLLATHTGPAFNLVLPQLAGLVTDRGGMLSHAAIVAREFGIPAVVGCANATTVIPNGARIRIDGDTGTVTVLDGG
ncbi:MAG: PEP-utilizing enzyme [Sporichthyaceae bacterium]